MSKSQRTKGKSFERSFVEFLRIYGYDAHRTQHEFPEMDEAGIDIYSDTMFNFQCKHVERLTMPHHEILDMMPTDKIPVVVHKRNHKGTIIAMKLEHFANLLLYKEDEH